MQVLTWEVSNQFCAMNVEDCREVVQTDRITPVPRSAAHIAGILNLRGDVVTVLDLRVMLGHSEIAERGLCTVIRLKGDGGQIAVRADSVSDVLAIETESIEPPPADMNHQESRYISGILQSKGRVALLLKPDGLLERVQK